MSGTTQLAGPHRFDRDAARAGKNDGMDRAERAANPEWWRFMWAALIETAQRKPFLFTDDLEQIRLSRGGPETHENRAIGPLMREAVKQGVCEPTDHWVASSQRQNHGRFMRVWYSLLYQGPAVKRPKMRRPIDPRQPDLWQ